MVCATRRRKPTIKEADLQRSFVDWLKLKGYCYFSVPNELPLQGNTRLQRFNQRLVKTGKKKGAPDLVVVLSETTILFFELKRNNKAKLSKNQKIFHSECPKKIHVVYELQEAIRLVESNLFKDEQCKNQ